MSVRAPSNGPSPSRGPLQYAVLVLKGFCMGAADVVPGVSGGTMAFILGIYEELIASIRSLDLQALGLLFTGRIGEFGSRFRWPFLLAVGGGILLAIFTLARLLSWLLVHHPVLIWSFFLGLILASVVSVSRRVGRWTPPLWGALAVGIAGSYILVGVVPVSTPTAPWFLFLSGGVAICAMILPGISGSFVLVLLGKYLYVLEAVNQRDLLTLAVVGAGAVAGLTAFSRLLGWLLQRHHDLMVALLTGLMLGSLRKVWPWKVTIKSMIGPEGRTVPLSQVNVLPAHWGEETAAALALALLGLALVLIMDAWARRAH